MINKRGMYRVFVLVAVFIFSSLYLTVYLQVKINMADVNTKRLPFGFCLAGFGVPSVNCGLL